MPREHHHAARRAYRPRPVRRSGRRRGRRTLCVRAGPSHGHGSRRRFSSASATATAMNAFEGLRVRTVGRPWLVAGQRANPFSLRVLREIARADVVHCHQQHILMSSTAAIAARALGRRVFCSDLGGGGWDVSAYVSTDAVVPRTPPHQRLQPRCSRPPGAAGRVGDSRWRRHRSLLARRRPQTRGPPRAVRRPHPAAQGSRRSRGCRRAVTRQCGLSGPRRRPTTCERLRARAAGRPRQLRARAHR